MTLEILTSNLLAPVRHGFFTRRGGASSGVFEGLNCGRGSSDQADVVTINRDRVARAMAAEPEQLRGLHQVHSAIAVVAPEAPAAPPPEADGIVTATPGLVLSVLTADCAPVLFADRDAGVVGAAHAGWRGALAGICESTIDRMVEAGARRSAIRAAIGPTISQRAYEVGPEFHAAFVGEDPQSERFFTGVTAERRHFDLPGFLLSRLRAAGIAEAEWTRHCTYCDPDLFFSYRRSLHKKEADYGRLISAVAL